MWDLKYIRENQDIVQQALSAKKSNFDLKSFLELDARRRDILTEVEALKNERNRVSDEIGALKRAGTDSAELMTSMKTLSQTIKDKDAVAKELDDQVMGQALMMPNKPHSSTPVGRGEQDNVVVKEWGSKPVFDFTPKPHWDLGVQTGFLDMERATKLSGSGFALYRGAGARLERNLLNFMLNVHTQEHAYEEVSPPFMVNGACMTGTGQLPKMAEDMYRIEGEDLYLVPTAEVPVTNIYRGETLDESDLPMAFAAYTPCFRKEAGAHGADTRGLIRMHQFDKVELVRLVRPEDSYAQLELLLGHAETILQKLGLSYRVLELCSADLSFAAAKCYDIEVWAPGQQCYLEVSSCSNFEDFQARRMGLKYKPSSGGKAQFVHTLNGSGLALARTYVALLETYQTAEGMIALPDCLR